MDQENNEKIEFLKKETVALQKEFKEKTYGYIMAALGLVAGLAWNEAIKGLIDFIYPSGGSGLWLKFVYAIAVTLFLVFFSLILAKIFSKKD
jgi:hypothetical protein